MKRATNIMLLVVSLAVSVPSLGGTDSRKSLGGFTIGMSSDEVTSALNALMVKEVAPQPRKARVQSLKIFGTPEYAAEVSGRFTKDTESIYIEAYFSPPPLPRRLVSLTKASQYKQGMTVANFKAAILEKYGAPSLLPEDEQGAGRTIVFWAWNHDGAPIKFSKKVFDDSRLYKQVPDMGTGSVAQMTANGLSSAGIGLDFVEEHAKQMRESGIAFCVVVDYSATNSIISGTNVTMIDVEQGVAALQQLANFVRSAADRKAQEGLKNAQQVKPTL